MSKSCYDGPKRSRTEEPDFTVIVGTGDQKQEFQCYRLILSLGSGYFDSMFSSGMKEVTNKEISFPDMDPEGWKEVYKFIDKMSYEASKVTHDNIVLLVPWFHLLQMEDKLQECDTLLDGTGTESEAQLKKLFPNPFDCAEFCKRYSLVNSYQECCLVIQEFLLSEDFCFNFADFEVRHACAAITYLDDHYEDEDDVLANAVTNFLKRFLPSDDVEVNRHLLKNPLLPNLIYDRIKMKVTGQFIQELPEEFPTEREKAIKHKFWFGRKFLKEIVDIPDNWNRNHRNN